MAPARDARALAHSLPFPNNSGSGNGPFGFGWSLSIPSIARKTDKGLPQYRDAEETDVYILSGAEDLVPVLIDQDGKWMREVLPDRIIGGQSYRVQRYRPRIEELFARIELWTNVQPGEEVKFPVCSQSERSD